MSSVNDGMKQKRVCECECILPLSLSHSSPKEQERRERRAAAGREEGGVVPVERRIAAQQDVHDDPNREHVALLAVAQRSVVDGLQDFGCCVCSL